MAEVVHRVGLLAREGQQDQLRKEHTRPENWTEKKKGWRPRFSNDSIHPQRCDNAEWQA